MPLWLVSNQGLHISPLVDYQGLANSTEGTGHSTLHFSRNTVTGRPRVVLSLQGLIEVLVIWDYFESRSRRVTDSKPETPTPDREQTSGGTVDRYILKKSEYVVVLCNHFNVRKNTREPQLAVNN